MAHVFLFLALLCCRFASAADVFAHFMVANSYSYTQSTWQGDIASAQQIGIDGFALNWAPPDCSPAPYQYDWNVQRIDDAFTVAAAQGFKLIYSFDMSYTPAFCTGPWNVTFMASMISRYASNPAAYRWNGNLLVSTYAGEGYGNAFFESLKATLSAEGINISLAPALTTFSGAAQNQDPTTVATGMFQNYTSIDGYFNWQAWPLDTKTNLTAAVDVAFEQALDNANRTGPYMMAVSPWQFKDLNDGYYNGWVEYSDVLFPSRWEEAINTVKPDIVEIITWNDFPESHYIRDLPPLTGPGSLQLGDSGAYVYGHNHSAWRVMAQYYISWYKTGCPPPVTEDRVVFWYRIHPKEVPCADGNNNIGIVRNADFPTDAVFAWALLAHDATVSMTVGSNQNWTFQAQARQPKLNMVPFPAGINNSAPYVAIERNGKTEYSASGGIPITQTCAYQDYNPEVGLVGPWISASPKMGNKSGRRWEGKCEKPSYRRSC